MEPTWTNVATNAIMALKGLLLVVVTAATPVLVRRVMDWLASKRAKDESDAGIAEAEDRQRKIENIIVMAVNATAQTYTSALKEAAADGKLTKEEAKEALAKTITTVRKHLIASGIPASSELLEDYIEEAVARYAPHNADTK